MKKLIVFMCIIALTTGCSLTSNKKMECKSSYTANGLTTKTTYDIEYQNDDVKKIKITYKYNQDEVVSNSSSDNSNNVVDGAVGEAIEDATDDILDITGIKTRHTNEVESYKNIEGFTSKVDEDDKNEYKIVYDIDMEKISDEDLSLLDLDRSFKTLKANYEEQGLTCK